MRLPMFQLIEETIALLERRKEYYHECSYEIQQMLEDALHSDALLGVNSRVKGAMSLREKIIRKRLYLRYGDAYEMLDALSDLVGLRVECRFLSEEVRIYEALKAACSLRNPDGTRSVPGYPHIRFELDTPQPEQQQNGMAIYRIDGHCYKDGISTPFEVQIKALVHVFWGEVEHQLIYKNHSYRLVDGFMKQLLFSTYANLEQVDNHLQLIYDQTQSATAPEYLLHNDGVETLVAKMISDLFFRRMEQQMGFSLQLRDACDAIAHYLVVKRAGGSFQETFQALYQRVANAAETPLAFEEMLSLETPFEADDPFLKTLGESLLQNWNTDYNWNLFFRMLFALEPGNNAEDFMGFLSTYRAQFAEESLYLPLYGAWGQARAEQFRADTLARLARLLAEEAEIKMLSRGTVLAIEAAISEACTLLAANMAEEDDVEGLLREALRHG